MLVMIDLHVLCHSKGKLLLPPALIILKNLLSKLAHPGMGKIQYYFFNLLILMGEKNIVFPCSDW